MGEWIDYYRILRSTCSLGAQPPGLAGTRSGSIVSRFVNMHVSAVDVNFLDRDQLRWIPENNFGR